MITSMPSRNHLPRAIAGLVGMPPPVAPPENVKEMFGRKSAPPPLNI
ncbi:hypothetical protein [Novosphingobium terrae]|nr:hypothetical protein [Novosphingobium terrae]